MIPPCTAAPPDVCCLVEIPNTSQWQVACPSTASVQAVPTLTSAGSMLLAITLCAAALWRLRR